MQGQANFAPSVTPRPQKAPSPRKARLITNTGIAQKGPAVSPIKVSASLALNNPSIDEPLPRPSKLKWDGDTHMVRNLQSHIHFGSTAISDVSEIKHVFEGYGIHLTTDEAKSLLCEYEENNEMHLPYQEFVDNFALMLRSKESGKRHAIKKTRLTEHVKRLQKFQHGIVQEINELLKEQLRESWSTFRETLQNLDTEKIGYLSAEIFLKVLRQFNISITMESLEKLMLKFNSNGDGIINYVEFLGQFGTSFSNSNCERVGNSILQHTIHDIPIPIVDETEESGSLQNIVHKFLHLKIGPYWINLKIELIKLNEIKMDDLISIDELNKILLNYTIKLNEIELNQLLKYLNKNKMDRIIHLNNFINLLNDLFNFQSTSLYMNDINNSIPNIKDYFSNLNDETWYLIYSDFIQADLNKTGWIPRGQFFYYLNKYMENISKNNILTLFRSFGSHHNDLMNYYDLIKSYRPKIMGFYNNNNIKNISINENLLLKNKIYEKRLKINKNEWNNIKNNFYTIDIKRIGRIKRNDFNFILKNNFNLNENEILYLNFIYEEKSNTKNISFIRYSSFLTDYDIINKNINENKLNKNLNKNSTQNLNENKLNKNLNENELNKNLNETKLNKNLNEIENLIRKELKLIEKELILNDMELKGIISYDIWLSILKKNNIEINNFEIFQKYLNKNLFLYQKYIFNLLSGINGISLINNNNYLNNENQINNLNDIHLILKYHLTTSNELNKNLYKYFYNLDIKKTGQLTYPEIRRVLEKIGIQINDPELFNSFTNYYDVDHTGFISYLQMLYANGGRNPDTINGMSDVASHSSYYSAISIAPKAAATKRKNIPKSLVAKDTLATQIVQRNVDQGTLTIGDTAAVEEKLKAILTKRWKTIHKMFQEIDTEKRGVITQASFKKVMENVGLALTFEEVLRISMKYDSDNSGRIDYHAFLKQHVQGKSVFTEFTTNATTRDRSNLPALSPMKSKIPEELKNTLKQKWKSVYASLKKLDASNSGRLSPQHFRHLLEWFGMSLTDDVFFALLKEYDSMEDGHVNYNVFMRACLET